ncbi:MAG TPA: PLDc N-terminal domain-containing protein [Niabella sp.]|nr:PLDc N-terminal domain-containing protein [Niabella sp.]HOZ97039.1 PLDc N-terminal domain-containing protein [Niabella sp.]HQW15029.1 PLDc N-terminal domain-containing protein [Niabella sp.]HQX20079.1 PLDc N-terminal domain-containing protein [Niabella sp.]HQX40409.1 PLDc N-terminal domain-containing protein [Niabella sp.]
MGLLNPDTAYFVWTVLTLILIIVWIVTLRDVLKSSFKEPNNKLVWTSVVILIPLVGVILYYLIGRSQKM